MRIRPTISILPLLLLATAITPLETTAQGGFEADRYVTRFALDGLRHPIFCGDVDSATGAPQTYGVRFDSLGRPTTVYRFHFGNLDSRGDWAIMRFLYDSTPSGGLIVTRTWHLPNGEPIRIGPAYGEQTLYDSTGMLRLVQLVDLSGDLLERVNAVTRQLFRRHPDGGIVQEWRYANNKQYHGGEPDIWNTQVGPLSEDAWFRHMQLDSNHFVIAEYPIGFDLRPLSFSDGVEMKTYLRNECGQPMAIEHRRRSGSMMADRNGVARLEFDYNDRGQITRWSAWDLEGNPAPYLDGAVRAERIYREFDGRLMREDRYDAGGLPLETSDR